MSERLRRLRVLMEKERLEALVVSTGVNRYYLSGFTGTAGVLVITGGESILYTDFRYLEQAVAECAGFQVRDHESRLPEKLAVDLNGYRRLGLEAADSHRFWQMAGENLSGELVPADTLMARLRMVKDAGEVECIRQAAAVADQVFGDLAGWLQPGMTELEATLELENRMRRLGASGTSFDTILASGERSALPHGVSSDRIIGIGDMVVLDFGCVVRHYCSDMTRTFYVGEPGPEEIRVYDIVQRARQEAIEAVRPGISAREVDRVARDIITGEGYGRFFGHGTGHGVGLEIHEEPGVSPRSETLLMENMVITVEPGIYLEGRFGVRIEDLVLVSAGGCEVLSRSSREFINLSSGWR